MDKLNAYMKPDIETLHRGVVKKNLEKEQLLDLVKHFRESTKDK